MAKIDTINYKRKPSKIFPHAASNVSDENRKHVYIIAYKQLKQEGDSKGIKTDSNCVSTTGDRSQSPDLTALLAKK
jgi:hypothetical protein